MACNSPSCRKCTFFAMTVLGVALLVAGIIVAVLGSFKTLAEDEIKKSLPLEAGSTSFENWKNPEGELFIEYYVFNITDVNVDNGNGPKIQQRGPYTYREVSSNNVTQRKGQTITYIPKTKYLYDPARSCVSCDPKKDKITTINYPLLVYLRGLSEGLNASRISRLRAEFSASITFQALSSNSIGLFQERTVDEILWGYQDVNFAKVVSVIINSTVPNRVYALQFNNSGSGITTIHSGEGDVDRVGEYLQWKSYKVLPWWNSLTANMINGTGGTRFRPGIEKDDELYVLVTEICRSLKVTYDSTVKVRGIKLYRFTAPKEAFESGTTNANNKGFCVTGKQKKCLPSGLLDVNLCKGGRSAPPFVASTPHFYSGDPTLAQMFMLTPTKEQHATFIDVEPITGFTMQGHKRLQLNFAMPSFSIKNILLNVNTSNPVYVPVFFTDESARISEEDADDFKQKVLLPLRAITALSYVMIALGGLFLFIALIIAIIHCKKSKKSKMTPNGNSFVMENYPHIEK